jgi:cytochrome c biogenesis protein CcmG, thiol:disulfide interchange protein DsbE
VPTGLKRGLQGLSVAVVAGLLALLVWKVVHQDKGVASQLEQGKRPAAPHFDLSRLDGTGKLSLASLRGKVVVLNFWASWCYPACYEEAPVLEAAWRAYRDRGLVVVGVDIQDTEAAASRFIKQFGLSFPNAPDPKGKVSIDYGVYGVPETFVIDKQGRIRDKKVGAVTEAYLREKIELLLQESS